MTPLEAIAVFAGIPILVVILVALPIFGKDWLAWLRGARANGPDTGGDADTDR